MNTDSIDPHRYARWWARVRDDRTICPCGNRVEAWASGPCILEHGDAICPRHRSLDRVAIATAVIDGMFCESDLTEEEAARASAFAHGNTEGVAHDDRPSVPAAFREAFGD